MATEKNHSGIHSPNDVAQFCYYLNYSWEAPASEEGYKTWVRKQGEKTNQGPESQLSVMLFLT